MGFYVKSLTVAHYFFLSVLFIVFLFFKSIYLVALRFNGWHFLQPRQLILRGIDAILFYPVGGEKSPAYCSTIACYTFFWLLLLSSSC